MKAKKIFDLFKESSSKAPPQACYLSARSLLRIYLQSNNDFDLFEQEFNDLLSSDKKLTDYVQNHTADMITSHMKWVQKFMRF